MSGFVFKHHHERKLMNKYLLLLSIALGLTASPAAFAERYLNMHTNAEPETIDPNLATGNVEHYYIVSLFAGLTTYDP